MAVAIQYSSSKAQAEALASKLKLAGSKVEIFQSDLTKSDSANTLVSEVKKSLGEIDILINNAGLMSDASIIQTAKLCFRSPGTTRGRSQGRKTTRRSRRRDR
ncbi:SDR family NAD(P)-dependent oxidoreductase [bacterium]|nr:SDR family NAD(P)-dependent oxidoreductase [bacterium]